MNVLADLARQHSAFVTESVFQRRLRVMQSVWRESQGFDMGIHRGKGGEQPLGSRLPMPWAKRTLANYLTDTIQEVVRREVLDPVRSKGKLYGKPRIFNDLLSSQPMAFNLFAELQQDLSLATSVFRDLAPGRIKEVTGIDFEYSPGRGDEKYTGDRSAFDVYALFQTENDGKGFAAIEVKYHENLQGKAADHRTRYDEVAEIMDCFQPEAWDKLKKQPLQQVWRDHLLAGAHRHVDGFDDGFFAFLYPQDNPECSRAMEAYAKCLTDDSTFVPWTLEGVHEAIKKHCQDDWVKLFWDRYLNFGKLDAA